MKDREIVVKLKFIVHQARQLNLKGNDLNKIADGYLEEAQAYQDGYKLCVMKDSSWLDNEFNMHVINDIDKLRANSAKTKKDAERALKKASVYMNIAQTFAKEHDLFITPEMQVVHLTWDKGQF